MSPSKQGTFCAILAFSMWGFFPLYFKSIEHISPLVILACRIIWSAVLLILIVTFLKQWQSLLALVKKKQQFFVLLTTAILIGVNWGFYVWAINNGYVFEASLAYFINPLINVFLGSVFLSEKLRSAQWFAVFLAVVGVTIETVALGQIPWIALTLSCAFGLYGLLHKQMQVDSISGLSVETFLLLPISLVYVIYLWQVEPSVASSPASWSLQDWLLLVAAGPVTVIPLLAFTMAAHRITLTALGFMQYITPTILFLLAALVYQQDYSVAKLLTFVFIWVALVIISIDAIKYRRRLSAS